MVRHADPAADAAACAEIYAPNVTAGVASFEDEAPDAAEMQRRIAETSERYPWLVAERDGAVAGYAYATVHRTRRAYRWTTEVTVYVDLRRHRSGVGRELYEALLPLLARQRLQVVVAGITLPNEASVALHEAVGFKPVGIYRGSASSSATGTTSAGGRCACSRPVPSLRSRSRPSGSGSGGPR
jgi:L-amino acid N-acyltransferase YncA